MGRSEQHRTSGLGRLARTAGLSILLATAIAAHAQTLTLLHSFSDGADGGYPEGGLSMDRAGNLYGTAGVGGLANSCPAWGCGTVFKLTYKNSAWQQSTIYSFRGGADGQWPYSRVVVAPDGTLYGTTPYGGQGDCHGNGPGCGVVFRLQPPAGVCRAILCPWTETVLYRFPGGAEGGMPAGDLIFDQAGNIYGTTLAGGYTGGTCGSYGCGVVYQLTPYNGGWTENVLYSFRGGADGRLAYGGVIRDASGSLFGITTEGGDQCGGSCCGTVFELSPSQSGWTKNTLYGFQGLNDGALPYGGLIVDGAGNLYGSASTYGSGGGGTVFELTSSGASWTFSVLYSLTGGFLGGPQGALTIDGAGTLYGAAQYDGANNVGSVFKLTPSNGGWLYTDLHDFTPQGDGGWLLDGLVLDSQENIYGTAFHGGVYGYGNVFQIAP